MLRLHFLVYYFKLTPPHFGFVMMISSTLQTQENKYNTKINNWRENEENGNSGQLTLPNQ